MSVDVADHPERAALLDRLRRLAKRRAKVLGNLAEIETERGELYRAARDLDPPIPNGTLGGIFGVSDAAVRQHLRRRD